MSKRPVFVVTRQHVAHVVINRPEVRNSLNREIIGELTRTFSALGDDKAAKVIVLYGAGKEAFCSGADLRELHALKTAAQRKKFFGGLAKLIAVMRRVPKPIIAKVHGYALAGGCGLAAACDLAFAAESARFGLPEVHIGLAPLVVLAPVTQAIGVRAAADLVLTGEQIGAARALELGLVSRVFKSEELDERVESIARAMAQKSPAALTAAKKALGEVANLTIEAALQKFPAKIAALAGGEDAMSGIAAHLAKHAPKPKG
jgi:methylglutaconyl-CoA hydratase